LDIEQRHNGQWILDVAFGKTAKDEITLLVPRLEEDIILYTLMEALIARSDRHVDENFKYKGFARFSRNNCVGAIAELSIETRGQASAANCANMNFDANLAQEKYDTDSSRVPELTQSTYSNLLRQRLESLDIKTGFKPA
jgi:hypothetical protein